MMMLQHSGWCRFERIQFQGWFAGHGASSCSGAAQQPAGAQLLAKSGHCPGPPGLGTASDSVTLLIQ